MVSAADHEELGSLAALDWSVRDPVPGRDPAGFDAALAELAPGPDGWHPGCLPPPDPPGSPSGPPGTGAAAASPAPAMAKTARMANRTG